MKEYLRVKREGAFDYKLVWREDFSDLVSELTALELRAKKACIVSDDKVFALFGEEVKKYLSTVFKEVSVFLFPAGEKSKNLETIQRLYRHLIETHVDRKDLLVALGGGVTGDMTGFAAATCLRGIDFIQIPTTLLAQVDSSIGGKTGVDFDQYKNMVGAFCQPRLVYMNIRLLSALSEDQFACGMAEVLKTALIYDREYYSWIRAHKEEILSRNPHFLTPMIRRSCEIKSLVVEQDPTEQGLRAILNFGHTIGHAIEKLMDFKMLHGQCVAIGMVGAAYLSWKRGWLTDGELSEIKESISEFGLPVSIAEGELSAEDILAAARSDKKVEQGKLKFILLSKPGKSVIDKAVTDQELLSAIHFIQGVSC